MVHFDKMGNLVRDNIFENSVRSHDEPPGKHQITSTRARTPATSSVTKGDAADPLPDKRREAPGRFDTALPGRLVQECSNLVRQGRFRTRDKKHAIFEADRMPSHHRDGDGSVAVGKHRAIADACTNCSGVDLTAQPRFLTADEIVRFAIGNMERNGQCRPSPVARNPQDHAPRAGIMTNSDRDSRFADGD